LGAALCQQETLDNAKKNCCWNSLKIH